MNTIAYCIPTYDRTKSVKETIEKCIDSLYEAGIDVYVYDSNIDDSTKKVVEEIISRGYDNLYHIYIPEVKTASDKIELMWKRYGHVKQYDYVWINKDRSYFSKQVIDDVQAACQENHDIVFIKTIRNMYERRNNTDHYDNAVDFYYDWAWLYTSLDTAVVKYDTVINKADIDGLREKHTTNGISYFVQVFVPFYVLADIQNLSIQLLEAYANIGNFAVDIPDDRRDDKLFEIWGTNWHYLNMNLPSIYDDYKISAIKRATGLSWLIGNEVRLIELWGKGILTDEKLEPVKAIWSEISDVPWENVEAIKSGKIDFMEEIYVGVMTYCISQKRFGYLKDYQNRLKVVVDKSRRRDIKLLFYIVEIYLIETESYGESHIFDNSTDIDALSQKLEICISFLKAIERNCPIKDEAVLNFLKNERVTEYRMAFLALNECENSQAAISAYYDSIS